MDSDGKSLRVLVEGRIAAPVARVFPLCCPVEESRWIDGWKCRLVRCPANRVEEGTVFTEFLSAPFLRRSVLGRTTWTAVLHDPDAHRLHFELSNVFATSLYKIEMEEDERGETRARLELTLTARNEQGARVVAGNGEARVRAMIELILAMLKGYCETGRKVGLGSLSLTALRAEGLTFADRLRVGANRLALSLSRDPRPLPSREAPGEWAGRS